ncbi:MAG: galactose oxidase-like domain-containing protein, partial [Actinomycetota bacterium]
FVVSGDVSPAPPTTQPPTTQPPTTQPPPPATGVGTGPGSWDPKVDMPLVPVAAANLPDGKVLLWSSWARYDFVGAGNDFTQTAIYDPATGAVSEREVRNTGHNMFCPGIANMPDGRVLVSGGSSTGETSVYNPANDTWEDAPDMLVGRGYHSNVTLSDGSVFTVGGSWSGPSGPKGGEIYRNGGWEWLPGIVGDNINTADKDGYWRSDNHMWLFAWENGRIFKAGPSRNMFWIDTNGQGSVQDLGTRGADVDAMNGNAVMYDTGKILTVGGAEHYEGAPSSTNAFVIDINGAVQAQQIESLKHGRTMGHSVVLPNGEVVVFGGIGWAQIFTDDGAVMIPELFDPDTNTFRDLAPMAVPRTYHSVGILLPDGRVMAGGGGLCGGCGANHADIEILTPPYLLDGAGNPAPRPVITSAPGAAGYGQTIPVSVSGGATDFSVVRLSNSTHSVNNAQRRIPLVISSSAGDNYSVQIPANAGVLPPGQYMLFAMNAAGTPSVSTTISIG